MRRMEFKRDFTYLPRLLTNKSAMFKEELVCPFGPENWARLCQQDACRLKTNAKSRKVRWKPTTEISEVMGKARSLSEDPRCNNQYEEATELGCCAGKVLLGVIPCLSYNRLYTTSRLGSYYD